MAKYSNGIRTFLIVLLVLIILGVGLGTTYLVKPDLFNFNKSGLKIVMCSADIDNTRTPTGLLCFGTRTSCKIKSEVVLGQQFNIEFIGDDGAVTTRNVDMSGIFTGIELREVPICTQASQITIKVRQPEGTKKEITAPVVFPD